MASETNLPFVTIGANVLVALCARELDKYDIAKKVIGEYFRAGYQFFAPGVIVSEVLYVFCGKLLNEKVLSPDQHAEAVEDLSDFMGSIEATPGGEGSLIKRASQITAGYGCSRSADSLYIALAETLIADGRNGVLLTFDHAIDSQISRHAATVKTHLLIASQMPPP